MELAIEKHFAGNIEKFQIVLHQAEIPGTEVLLYNPKSEFWDLKQHFKSVSVRIKLVGKFSDNHGTSFNRFHILNLEHYYLVVERSLAI